MTNFKVALEGNIISYIYALLDLEIVDELLMTI